MSDTLILTVSPPYDDANELACVSEIARGIRIDTQIEIEDLIFAHGSRKATPKKADRFIRHAIEAIQLLNESGFYLIKVVQ